MKVRPSVKKIVRKVQDYKKKRSCYGYLR